MHLIDSIQTSRGKYPQSKFGAKARKNITIFHLKIITSTAIKLQLIALVCLRNTAGCHIAIMNDPVSVRNVVNRDCILIQVVSQSS